MKLIAPIDVKPYVKRAKSDAADAEAIGEAVTRPTIRFVEVKSPEEQAIQLLQRARDLIVRQRTQTTNMLLGLMAEFGVNFAQDVGHAVKSAKRVAEGHLPHLPPAACGVVTDITEQLLKLHGRVNWYRHRMITVVMSEPRIALLQTIPGIAPITASAIVATVGSGERFQSVRVLSAWLGLTPINKSTGGKERLGPISKIGDRYIRRLLVVAVTFRIKQIKTAAERFDPWLADILQRKPAKLAVIAMANKTARNIWAVLTPNEPYEVRIV